MCSFLNNWFTVAVNINTMYCKNGIGNRNFHSKLPIIVFQINLINLIESKQFRETSTVKLRKYFECFDIEIFQLN